MKILEAKDSVIIIIIIYEGDKQIWGIFLKKKRELFLKLFCKFKTLSKYKVKIGWVEEANICFPQD